MKRRIEVGNEYIREDGGDLIKVIGKHVNAGEWNVEVSLPYYKDEDSDECEWVYAYTTIMTSQELSRFN